MGKKKSVAATTTPVEPSWNLVFKQLQEDQVKFYLSTQLEPMASIPSDGFQTEWPVDGQRFQDLLVSMFYEITGEILKSNERDFMMAQFREECRKGGRQLTEEEAVETDQDVMVQAILFLINASLELKTSGDTEVSADATVKPVFNDRTALLVQKLRGFQKDGSIPCHQEISLFTNIFSRKLARLVPVLRGYGVQIELNHAEDGSRCKVTRLAEFQFEPDARHVQPSADDNTTAASGQSSGVKSVTGSQIQQPDGTDGNTRVESHNEKATLKQPNSSESEVASTAATVGSSATPTAKKVGAK